jgi:hypothetical protein
MSYFLSFVGLFLLYLVYLVISSFRESRYYDCPSSGKNC